MRFLKRFRAFGMALSSLVWIAPTVFGQSHDWTVPLSAPSQTNVSADGLGGVYVSSNANIATTNDPRLEKFDTSGNLLWTRTLGSGGIEEAHGVSVDGLGNVYLSGFTQSLLDGSLKPPGSNWDWEAFLVKFDSAGVQQWTRYAGLTTGSAQSWDVTADTFGKVYLAGGTNSEVGGPTAGLQDAFLQKFDSAGNLIWTRKLGSTESDVGYAVATDELGSVYFAGRTLGNLSGTNAGDEDAFAAKFTSEGELLWVQQFGETYKDVATGISADQFGNVYVSGYGVGVDHGSGFLRKFDASGSTLWTRYYESSTINAGRYDNDIALDELGNVFLSSTYRRTSFLSKYDPDGNRVWIEEVANQTSSGGVSTDGQGSVYIASAVLAKYNDVPVPEPLPGDYDQNGVIDAADYTVWRNYLGQTFTLTNENPAAATLGVVDAEDYDFWKAQYGQGPGSGSGTSANAAVPEPTSLVLMMLTAAGWCLLRRGPYGKSQQLIRA